MKIEFSGPIYTDMKVDGHRITLHFAHADGLAAKGGKLQWFQIAGADGNFVDATATIEGQNIAVRSESVAKPVSVGYAWDNYPAGANLVNGAGLPAAPFRTDSLDALTPVAKEFTGK